MRHRADDNNVPWMDKLVDDEIKGVDKTASVNEEFVATVLGDRNPFGNSIIDKIADDEAASQPTVPAANRAVDTAPTDAGAPAMSMDDIEKKIDSATSVEELDALEDQLKKMNMGDDSGSAPTAGDPTAMPVDGAAPSVNGAPSAGGADIASLKDDIGKIKESIDDKSQKTNDALLLEIKKLNEAMGADKTVDLNNTIDQSS